MKDLRPEGNIGFELWLHTICSHIWSHSFYFRLPASELLILDVMERTVLVIIGAGGMGTAIARRLGPGHRIIPGDFSEPWAPESQKHFDSKATMSTATFYT